MEDEAILAGGRSVNGSGGVVDVGEKDVHVLVETPPKSDEVVGWNGSMVVDGNGTKGSITNGPPLVVVVVEVVAVTGWEEPHGLGLVTISYDGGSSVLVVLHGSLIPSKSTSPGAEVSLVSSCSSSLSVDCSFLLISKANFKLSSSCFLSLSSSSACSLDILRAN
jgi:hypothetical protein